NRQVVAAAFAAERLLVENVVLLEHLEALDLPTKTGDLTGQVGEDHLLRGDAEAVHVEVGGVGGNAVSDATHYGLVLDGVRQEAGRMEQTLARQRLHGAGHWIAPESKRVMPAAPPVVAFIY